jgi:hypothetical protein
LEGRLAQVRDRGPDPVQALLLEGVGLVANSQEEEEEELGLGGLAAEGQVVDRDDAGYAHADFQDVRMAALALVVGL